VSHKLFVQTGPTMSKPKFENVPAKEQTRKQDGGAHESVSRGRASTLSQKEKGRSASNDMENMNRNTEEYSHSPSNEETWSCETCEFDVNDKLLSCDYCGHHRSGVFHVWE